jgi:hypothetical protein
LLLPRIEVTKALEPDIALGPEGKITVIRKHKDFLSSGEVSFELYLY